LELPHSFYNIIDGRNTLEIDVFSTGPTTFLRTDNITIPSAYYTTTNLIAEMKSQLNAIGGGVVYTIAQSETTRKLTISVAGAFSLLYTYANNTIGRRIGFTEDNAGTAMIATRPVDLRGITSLMIQSSLANDNSISYSGDSGTIIPFLAEIKITEGFGGTVFFENNNPLDIIQLDSIPDVITMSLRNRKTELIDLNGFDWRMELLVDHR
jgi:hypothetical protein